MEETQRLSLTPRAWANVAALWLALSIAWAPAALLASPGVAIGPGSIVAALVQNLIHFAPWALAVALSLGLARRRCSPCWPWPSCRPSPAWACLPRACCSRSRLAAAFGGAADLAFEQTDGTARARVRLPFEVAGNEGEAG